jgi:hypothetical protein
MTGSPRYLHDLSYPDPFPTVTGFGGINENVPIIRGTYIKLFSSSPTPSGNAYFYIDADETLTQGISISLDPVERTDTISTSHRLTIKKGRPGGLEDLLEPTVADSMHRHMEYSTSDIVYAKSVDHPRVTLERAVKQYVDAWYPAAVDEGNEREHATYRSAVTNYIANTFGTRSSTTGVLALQQ